MKKTITIIVAAVVVVLAWVFWPSKPAQANEITVGNTSVDFYGTINYKLSNDENSSGNTYTKAENNGSKIGVNITENISDGISGFATVELGLDADDSDNNPLDSRLAFAGLDFGQVGKISAGRQASPFTTNISGHTDVFEVYGSGADQNLFARDTNTIAYSNTVGALTFDGLVKVDGSTGKDGIDVQEGTVSISEGIVSASVGMSNDRVNSIDYYGAGVTVDLDVATVGYSYTMKDATTDVTANEVIVSKTVDATTFTGGYGKVEDSTAYYTAGVSHSFTEALSSYAEFQRADNTGATNDTESYSAGIKFAF
jgi:predicted porin